MSLHFIFHTPNQHGAADHQSRGVYILMNKELEGETLFVDLRSNIHRWSPTDCTVEIAAAERSFLSRAAGLDCCLLRVSRIIPLLLQPSSEELRTDS